MAITGVYTITNIHNKKIYVGSSKDINKRWNVHLSHLRLNKHCNNYLQATFNKYGTDSLKFEILEECPNEYLLSTEQFWINMLGVTNNKLGYNLCRVAGTTLGFRHSEDTKLKMSNSKKGVPKTLEHKLNMRGRLKTMEERLNLSIKNKGTKPSAYTTQRTVEVCSIPLEIYKDNDLYNTFKSTAEAARVLNLDRRSIFKVLSGKKSAYKGFTFKQIKNAS